MSRTASSPRSGTGPAVCRDDIVSALRRLGIGSGETIWAHSSLSAFGRVDGGANTVIDGLLDTVGPNGTVALPTFTWREFHAAHEVVFDLAETACETGIIPETFRKRPGVRRSLHICHSVAALGPQTENLLGDGVRSFWGRAVFDALYACDAWNVMLGVGYQSCTALHAAEEIVQVPYRSYRDFVGSRVRLPDGTELPCVSVEYLRQDDSFNDFAKMEGILAAKGRLEATQVGNARVTAARIRDVIDEAVERLRENPRFLSGTR